MTRPIDTTLLGHIQNDAVIYPFVAVAINTASGNFYFKTNSGDLTFGGHTYLADGSLESIGSMVENRDLSQNGVTINFSGLNATLLAALKANNSPNFPVTIYVGLQDAKNTLIGSPIALGPFLLFQPVIEISKENYRLTVNVEYYTTTLQKINNLLFTDLAQQSRHTGDLFFHLIATLYSFQMLWGQKSVANGAGATKPGVGGGGGSGGGMRIGGMGLTKLK